MKRYIVEDESVVLGPEVVQQIIENLKMIHEKMRTSQSRRKSYHDNRRKALEFQERDNAFLRVTLVTGVGRALKSQKLIPHFISPYQFFRRVGKVAYQIALPPSLSNLHSVLHVSQLCKYISDILHVIRSDDVRIIDHLTYERHHLCELKIER